MKAIDRPFTKIINGTTQFTVPVFQRDYKWSEPQCEQLWKDLLQAAQRPGESGHFLGSIVYVSTGDTAAGFTRWMLVDGQQRVTTLTLLLAALRDHIAETGWQGSEDGPTVNRLEAYFLKNVQESGARRNKLVLRRHDQATLVSILDRSERPKNASDRIVENYDYFRERLKEVDPETVYRGVGRLVVVDVTLDRATDDPQLIFESLNSTGIDLSQADLIRNFILMRLPEREQTRLYETYWSRIETLFRGSERTFDAFARDFLALRTRTSRQEKAEDIYFAFRREFGLLVSAPGSLEELLQELLRFARYHAAFSIGTGEWEPLREPLARLRHLVDVPATVVMRLFDLMESRKSLSVAELSEAIELLESYVFRRAICEEQTRGYWQIFANLAYRLSETAPLESLKVGLAALPESYAFPQDDSFSAALLERDVYHKRVCFHLLESLENWQSKERSDTRKYSIEHILPQNEKLSAPWRRMLGEDWKNVQREWLHRLGNLTLTGYNSKYSDRSFEDKKSIPHGFRESSVRLNKYVCEQEAWTQREISARGRSLAKRALQIWRSLNVSKHLVEAARAEALKEQARHQDVTKVKMTGTARGLFDALRPRLLDLDAGVIEVAGAKTVSYHGPTFFVEVLPRKEQLVLLLPLDFNEIEDEFGLARDTSQWKFLVNAEHEGGVHLIIREVGDIERALPILRQAHEVACK